MRLNAMSTHVWTIVLGYLLTVSAPRDLNVDCRDWTEIEVTCRPCEKSHVSLHAELANASESERYGVHRPAQQSSYSATQSNRGHFLGRLLTSLPRFEYVTGGTGTCKATQHTRSGVSMPLTGPRLAN